MAKAPKDEFGTPFGQAGSAAATKLGTPFGQAPAAPTKTKTKLETFQEEKAQRDADIAVAKRAQEDATAAAFANKPADEPGFTWRFVTLAGGGGEWRKYKSSTGPTGGGDGGGGSDKDKATQDFLLSEQKRAQAEADLRDRQSAYDILYNEFSKYGLASLVEDIKGLLQSNVSPSQFALELQNTKSYKERFKANEARIAAGLSALRPAEYVALEDQYQNIMRNYGLPASYYTKDQTGKQVGFEKFIAGDVSATELEDRISTAQKRVINANPEVSQALKAFYPDITNGDILAYALDPSQGLEAIKRKVTAAEIGGAAMGQNLATSEARAMQLAGYGVTKEQAQQGFQTVAEVAPRGSQLADIYGQAPYGQAEAEAEVFNTQGAAQAAARRKKLKSLEEASFSGSSGVGALGRDKAIYGGASGQAGLY
jgi:hypothetical protein